MTRSSPDFVIAGAARAGTTALVEGLRSHPGVFVTDPKEPHYFAMHGSCPDYRGPGDQETINRAAVTDRGDYLGLYPDDSGDQLLGEGSVSTLYYYERAVPELLRMNPDVRVIVLLRNPVERAFSSFQYLRAQGREPEDDFLAAVAAEPERRAANWHHLWHYTSMSLYADAIAALREMLPPANLGIWFYDDLDRDFAGTLEEVIDFLGLDHVPGLGHVPRVNISGTPRFRHLQQMLWTASGNPELRRTTRLLTTWRFREAVKSRIIRRDPVPVEITKALAPGFEADLLRLHDFLVEDVRMPEWLTTGAVRAG